MSVASAIAVKARRDLANSFRAARKQSVFKVVFVSCFAAACEAGLFVLFREGFAFLDTFGGFGGLIMGRLFALFFLGLGAMLVVSSLVTSYATVFRSRETEFLLAGPVPIPQLMVYKFVETAFLASWAFFFIIIPFVAAYAWHARLSLLFALWTLCFSVPFVALCSGAGTLGTLLCVRWFPAGRPRRVCGLALAAGACAAAAWVARQSAGAGGDADAPFTLSSLVPGVVLASNILMPSSWVSQGILSLSRGQWVRGALLGGTLLSTALLVFTGVEWWGGRVFYACWQRAASGSRNRRRPAVLFGRGERLLGFLGRDVRALVMKDLRTFVRDPVQWSQALVFFGLLGLYFANLRSLNYPLMREHWRNLMVFLNVFSVSAVVCSLGSRFVYPQLSLEGQEFWVLGLAPTTLRRIVLAKFAVALSGVLLVSVALAGLSAAKLNAPASSRGVCLALACAVSCAVCGLSTGLGAVFLDLRQRNPAAIVSGFGGTLNLVLSLGFMLLAILPFAAGFHLHALGRLGAGALRAWVWVAGAWLLAITAAATAMPLCLGIRAVRRRDF